MKNLFNVVKNVFVINLNRTDTVSVSVEYTETDGGFNTVIKDLDKDLVSSRVKCMAVVMTIVDGLPNGSKIGGASVVEVKRGIKNALVNCHPIDPSWGSWIKIGGVSLSTYLP